MAPRPTAHRRILPLLSPAVVLFVAAACGSPAPVVEGLPGPRRTLTGANLTAIAMAANNAEIGEAQLALARSRNDAVRQFAQRMITDHTAFNQEIMQIADRVGMQPEELTAEIQANAQRSRQSLEARTGAEFDRAYIAHQISMHRWLLETIDNVFIPAAGDSRLEGLLEARRATVADHLRQAQQVQQMLGDP